MSARVIIVGAGFGGLNAAKLLAESGGDFTITIIDMKNHHLFQPLLYQVATAGLGPAEIAVPIRSVLAKYRSVSVILAEARHVDLKERLIGTNIGQYSYDYLILACGATTSYFGRPRWESHAPSLKSLEQATEIRRRILNAFEQAETAFDSRQQNAYLTFVIVGGGPTGVELAGALGELCRHTLSRDFRRIEWSQARIVLIEASERILSSFSEEMSYKATRSLMELGVEVKVRSKVLDIDGDGVSLNGEKIAAHTVLWAAGVAPSPLNKILDVDLDAQGRVIVSSDLSLSKYQEVFVIGDQAHVKGKDSKPLPGVAPVAMQQGKHAARNILRLLRNESTREFKYRDKGQLATIGRKRAVLEAGRIKLSGTFAWIMWLIVHIFYLIGFRNRLFVLLEWMWYYVTFKKGSRIIVAKEWRSM